MSVFNNTIESFDFKQIAQATSTIRAVSTGLGLLGITVSYNGLVKNEDDPQCEGLNKSACDAFRFIYLF
jgi:phage terminase large subunit